MYLTLNRTMRECVWAVLVKCNMSIPHQLTRISTEPNFFGLRHRHAVGRLNDISKSAVQEQNSNFISR